MLTLDFAMQNPGTLRICHLHWFISRCCGLTAITTVTMISSGHWSASFFLLSILSCFFFILVAFSATSSSSATALLMTSFHSQQCLDLLDLKRGFIMLNESNNYYYDNPATTSLPHWLAGTNCCGWEGVSCDEASGLVVSLDLRERYMGGDIMPSIFNLTSLQRLNLAFNRFNQSNDLLSDWEKLANLTHLNLSSSGLLVGQVPIGISRLTKLISLDLSSSSLKLEKPDLGTLIRDLSNLKELYLDYADISSSRTEWSKAISDSVPGLQALSLRDCSLSGPIDSSFSKLWNLSIIRLDGNYLLSHLPDFFANFSSLSVLSLSGCGLVGFNPTSVSQLLNLKTLDLSYNPMLASVSPGNLLNSLGNLKSLKSLNLGSCNLSGTIPWSIWNLSELVHIDLSSNQLSGGLPPMFVGSKISIIVLYYNNLTGSIPSTFGYASHLVSLDLAVNSLTGSIPMSLFTLPILEKLNLAGNRLSGQLQEFTNASSTLQHVNLWDNNLHGKLPKSLADLPALISLNIGSNNFDGVVDLHWFGHLKNLTRLYLSDINMVISDRTTDSSLPFPSLNDLTLQSCNLTAIPSFLEHKKNMQQLDLSNNAIKGIIPKWIWSIGSLSLSMNLSCNLFTDIEMPHPNPPTMMSISSLDLHSNMLQGPIPFVKAYVLDYSNNHFTGSIPLNISAYLRDTSSISLSNNSLSGEVPTSFCSAINLEFLDLSKNNLSGSIPGCLMESLSELQVLNVRENRFEGILPQNINSRSSLQTINFYGNKLEGEIPMSLANCEKLEFLDLGSNKLADYFPYWLGNLSALKVLVLRENRFYGNFECPPRMYVGNHIFEMLQILDISSNNFTGSLPIDCFTKMKAMMMQPKGTGTIGFQYFPSLGSYSLSLYYYYPVTIITKGYKRELVKIPTTTAYIDVSNNRFVGILPEVIGSLDSLYLLNMSLNAFKGPIPQVFGNLRYLESLDLSGNQLSGEIPNSLTSLTFLSFLNLSNNNLAGRIPQGNQFNTFPNSSFEGNPRLCDGPLSRACVNLTSLEPSMDLNDAFPEFDMEEVLIWLFKGLGFGVGFALAITRQLLFAKVKIWYKKRFMSRNRRGFSKPKVQVQSWQQT